ncbi:unnamed protein product [Phytomonas sp. Hart1]|nr:unnamed protein product [Phytomonas sp. Hart1]|eukprot:CCW66319.1 unnamed protein product [Phytomonas sp. isolate Hart1]
MQLVGSSYEGQFTVDGKRFHGFGQYTFSNGNRYVGGMFEGMFHGNGVIFFRKPTFSREPSVLLKQIAEADRTSTTADAFKANANGEIRGIKPTEKGAVEVEWDGLYRGVWEHGRNVSGCYVFGDGLVYGSHASSSLAKPEGNSRDCTFLPPSTSWNSRISSFTGALAPFAWTYCKGEDHRLWDECLGGLSPVQPYESVLGGVGKTARARNMRAAFSSRITENDEDDDDGDEKTPQERRSEEIAKLWLSIPVVDSCTGCVRRTAPAFAEGQPRMGSDVDKLMSTPEGIENMRNLLKIPTLPFGQGM